MSSNYINKKTYCQTIIDNVAQSGGTFAQVFRIQNPGQQIQIRRIIYDIQVTKQSDDTTIPFATTALWHAILGINSNNAQVAEAFYDITGDLPTTNGNFFYILTPGGYEYNGFKFANEIVFEYTFTNRSPDVYNIRVSIVVTTKEKSLNL